MSKLPRLIPLGSAVELKDPEEEGIYVVIGRAFMNAQTSGYQAVAYPQGYGENYRIYIFREEQIKVVTEGYSNEKEELAFIKERLVEMEKRQQTPPPAVVKSDETDQPKVLSHEEQLVQDPFYKFR